MKEDRISSLYIKLKEAIDIAINAGITEEEATFLLFSNGIDFLINLLDVAVIRVKGKQESGK